VKSVIAAGEAPFSIAALTPATSISMAAAPPRTCGCRFRRDHRRHHIRGLVGLALPGEQLLWRQGAAVGNGAHRSPGSKLSAMAPVLTLPEAFILRNGAFVRGARINIYILINNKVEREFQLVPNSTIEIAARTSASVTTTQTRSILYENF
jgi:hypothetical protein